jgi:Ca2+-binding EF-hand superfamily protein
LSTDKLADYKKKAGADATAADKAGDTKKGNKRFSGIMKATRKQFDNDAKKTNEDVTEASQRVDSLVTDALKVMQGSELKDAVQALKTVLGDREYNDRRGHYNFYVKQLVDMYGKKTNEELSPKQKEIDKNKNGKIDGFDLAHLRKKTEELSPAQKAIDKNKNGKIDGTDLAHLRDKKKPQGADFAAQRRKERLASNGRMDEAKSDYEVYHKDYSGAVQTAIKQAEKRGFEVDMDDWHDKVATGPKKPSAGKTNSFSVKLKKDGKESKKALHLQVYNMDNHKYELNMYIESVEEAASPAQQAAIAIAMKKAGKKPKDMEESDAYDKDVKPSDKPHDKEAAAKRAKLAALAARKKMSEGIVNTIKDKLNKLKRGNEAQQKADDHFDKAGDPKNANASKDLKKAVRYHNLLNKEENGIQANPVTKHVTKGEVTKSGVAKWLAEPLKKEEAVPEFKQGGSELAKKFNKAFKSVGVDAKVKIKTVGNVSANEEVVFEAKKPKSFKDVKKKMKEEEKPNKSTIQKGDDLTGKKEPIEVNPELKESKNNE